MKVGIVGGGVFGCVIGRELHESGFDVTIFDCRKEQAASRASGFLMKPSWFSGMKKKEVDRSFELLDRLYGLQKIKFNLEPLNVKLASVYRVDKSKVLDDPKLNILEGKVRSIEMESGRDRRILTLKTGQEFQFEAVVVAAGIWSSKLLPSVEVYGKTGISFEWKGEIEKPFIKPWAPYKQIIAFNIPGKERVWAGDGSAIKQENWTQERTSQCLERVSKATGLESGDAEFHIGVRPFVDGAKPCLYEKRGHNLWLVTGGGKIGTIGAAWAARKLLKELE